MISHIQFTTLEADIFIWTEKSINICVADSVN